jgi:hypothetical protein
MPFHLRQNLPEAVERDRASSGAAEEAATGRGRRTIQRRGAAGEKRQAHFRLRQTTGVRLPNRQVANWAYSRFGVNLLTEVMHTFGPDRFVVLNKNPLATLKKFGCDPFPSSNSFTPEMYAQFNDIVAEVKTECGFQSMSQADHFLSYVYWAVKNKGKKGKYVPANTSQSEPPANS